MTKTLFAIGAFCAAMLLVTACQNRPQKKPEDFDAKTHRTYNPETGTFEQSPPWGKQGNKSDTQ